MDNRHQQDIEIICDKAIALLHRINDARHGGDSSMIPQIISAFEDLRMLNPDLNIQSHLKVIQHLMDFELDPDFTAQEKIVLQGSMKQLEAEKVKLEPNVSNLQIQASALSFTPKELDTLRNAWKEVTAQLKQEEQKRNGPLKAALNENKTSSAKNIPRSERIKMIRQQVKAGNLKLQKERNRNKAATRTEAVSKEGMFAKRHPDVSPRSIHEESNPDKNTDKKRTRRNS